MSYFHYCAMRLIYHVANDVAGVVGFVSREYHTLVVACRWRRAQTRNELRFSCNCLYYQFRVYKWPFCNNANDNASPCRPHCDAHIYNRHRSDINLFAHRIYHNKRPDCS